MRIARKLMLLAITAIAAMALGASTASAQAVEVSNEATGVHCNPCVIHVDGSDVLSEHTFGTEGTISQCTEEFDLEIYENGRADTHNQVLSGAQCTKQACRTSTETEWLGQGAAAETGASTTTGDVEFCYETIGGGLDEHCIATVTTVTAIDHSGEGEVHDDCPLSREVNAHFDSEAGEDVSVVHL